MVDIIHPIIHPIIVVLVVMVVMVVMVVIFISVHSTTGYKTVIYKITDQLLALV